MRGWCRPHLIAMHPPIFVRELSGAERGQLEAGLRAASAFTVRRAQIVLLSAAGRRQSHRACAVRCRRCGTPSTRSTAAALRP